jgi:anthranilate synthase component 1
LCRTDKARMVVNRPLAGTRMRGKTKEAGAVVFPAKI